MKENFFDNVLKKTLKRVDGATDRLSKQFKNVKPFDKEVIPKKELYSSYRMLTPEDMQALLQQHGPEVVDDFIKEMEEYGGRYGNA